MTSKRSFLIIFFGLLISNPNFADVKVKSYFKKDGTYVQSHHRSNPDGNFNNNWSTVGNVNPYTGELGTKIENPNIEKTYTPSTVKDLNIPYTNHQLTNSSTTNRTENFETIPKLTANHDIQKNIYTPITSNIPPIDMLESELPKSADTPLNSFSFKGNTSNLSHIDMLDLESKIRASRRLKNLGYKGNTSDLSYMDMLDLESRIRASQRLKNLGYKGNTSNLSHMDMLDLESRIRASQRLKNLGYKDNTFNLSYMDMLDLESKIRASRRFEN